MKKLLKPGANYFIYELIFVTIVFIGLSMAVLNSGPIEVQKQCDSVTGRCISEKK